VCRTYGAWVLFVFVSPPFRAGLNCVARPALMRGVAGCFLIGPARLVICRIRFEIADGKRQWLGAGGPWRESQERVSADAI